MFRFLRPHKLGEISSFNKGPESSGWKWKFSKVDGQIYSKQPKPLSKRKKSITLTHSCVWWHDRKARKHVNKKWKQSNLFNLKFRLVLRCCLPIPFWFHYSHMLIANLFSFTSPSAFVCAFVDFVCYPLLLSVCQFRVFDRSSVRSLGLNWMSIDPQTPRHAFLVKNNEFKHWLKLRESQKMTGKWISNTIRFWLKQMNHSQAKLNTNVQIIYRRLEGFYLVWNNLNRRSNIRFGLIAHAKGLKIWKF